MRKTVWLTTTLATPEESPAVAALLERARRTLLTPPDPRYARYPPADSPESADIILFLEDNRYKTRAHLDRLRGNELLRRFPERCFAFDFQPEPPPLLPGVYVSLSRRHHDPRRFRAGGYLAMYNETPLALAGDARAAEPDLLCSFRGSRRPHPVRCALLAAGLEKEPGFSIAGTERWIDFDENEKQEFAREVCRSKFVLCPRGVATSSYRMYETMALGRVPVVIADDWVAPDGVDWSRCILRVAERRIADIPRLLRQHEPEWREMGDYARRVWERRFHPDLALYRTLRAVEELLLLQSPEERREAQREWRTTAFAWRQGWTAPQQWYRAYRLGQYRAPLLRRALRADRRSLTVV